jgi:hypothetical protein
MFHQAERIMLVYIVANDQILVYDDNPALDILISQTHTLKNPNQLSSNGRVDSVSRFLDPSHSL